MCSGQGLITSVLPQLMMVLHRSLSSIPTQSANQCHAQTGCSLFLISLSPRVLGQDCILGPNQKKNNYVKKFSISDQITPISVLQNRNPSTVETESGLLTRGYDCFDLLFPMRLPMHSNSIKPDIMHVPA